VNSDWTDLLNLFNASKVRFLVVGAHAVMWHTEPRFTKDLDLGIEPTARNGERAYQALQKFGAPLLDLSPKNFGRPGLFYQLGRPPSRVDILTSVPPLRFEECWKARCDGDFVGVPISFLGIESLIEAKRLLNRPQDAIDVDWLIKAQQERGGK
jgi:hypothetical protein